MKIARLSLSAALLAALALPAAADDPAPRAAAPAAPLASRAALQALLPKQAVLMDSFAAVVNQKVITVGEVLAAMQPRMQQIARSTPRAQLESALRAEYEKTRDSMVDTELILMEFKAAGGQLPPRAIEDHIATILRERFGGDRAALLRALAAERLTLDEWRAQMMDQLAVQVMRQKEITSKILVTPFDVQCAYRDRIAEFTHPDRVHIRMLTLPQGKTPEEVAANRALAERVRSRILEGVAGFPEAARLLSSAPGAAGNRGDAGWHATSSLAPGVAEAVAALEPGALSEVLDLPPDFYIVQLEERESASVDPLPDIAADIERDLRRAEYDRLESIWMASLRGKYYIQLYNHEIFTP